MQFLWLFLILAGQLYSLDLDPDGKKVKRGNQYFTKGEYSTALQEYNAVEMEDPRVHFNRGTALHKMKEYDRAIEEFSRVVAETKNNELKKKSWFNMGNAYKEKGDTKKAATSWMESLKIDPEYEAARKNLDLLKKNENKQNQEQQNPSDQTNKEQQEQKKDHNAKQEKNSPSSSSKKGNGKNPVKLDPDRLDQILKAGNPEKIQRKKSKAEYGENTDRFW